MGLRCMDETLSTPLYEQLAAILREQVRQGELKPGDALPTEAELGAQFKVSRITVRQAVLMLTREGLIYRKRGKGSFVCNPKIVQPLIMLRSFSDEIRILGHQPGVKLLRHRIMDAPPDVAEPLGLAAGDQVLEVVRLRLADGEALSVNFSYLPVALAGPLTADDLAAGSLYQSIGRKVGKIVRGREMFTATAASVEEARHLDVREGEPLLRLVRTAYLAGGEPVEFVRADFRPDRYEIYIELRAFT